MLKSPFTIKSLSLFSCMILISACSDGQDVSANAKQAVQAPAAAAQSSKTNAASRQAAAPSAKTGTVKSTRVAGAYSYIETDINGQLFWLATSTTPVNPGDTIAWNDHAVMKNFNSKALNHTFDQILFVDRVFSPNQKGPATHSGTVLEALTSAGYSYIHVDEKGKKMWLAAPQMTLTVGQTIRWSGGSAMHNFSSRSLDRTFDEIFFVNAVHITKG